MALKHKSDEKKAEASFEWWDAMVTQLYYDIIIHNSMIEMRYHVTLITTEMRYI